jgi:O-antigen ligase
MYSGVTTGKNLLGVVCLVSWIFFFWDTLVRWSDRKVRRTRRIIIVNLAFIVMTLWLLNLARSATSSVCLAIGTLVIVATRTKVFKRHPAFLKFLIPVTFCTYLILALGFDINGKLAGAVGRDSTLTDRTFIWKVLLNMHTNPILGTGYESFWLGPRLKKVWESVGAINEAHNGYLEVYLNLGLTGLALLIGFLVASYRNICKRLKPPSDLASLSLAVWTMMLFYNVSEAAFKFHQMWITFLLVAIAVPEPVGKRVLSLADRGNADATDRSVLLRSRPQIQRR